jgi:uncharacterized membrane protein YgcG
MTQLKMLTTDDKLAEIRRLYFNTTRQTIQADLTKALDLLKTFGPEEERERAAVYMDGLAQMRSEWARQDRARGRSGKSAKSGGAGKPGRSGKSGRSGKTGGSGKAGSGGSGGSSKA